MVTRYSSYFITIYNTTVRLRNIRQPRKFDTKKNEETHAYTFGNSVLWLFPTLYTGWGILSRTTAIPHIVHQGDTPVYYLHVILMIWNILTHHWTNGREQTRKNVWCNVNGIEDCKKTTVPSFVSIWRKIFVNVLKQSWKCPELKCLIKNCKHFSFREYSASNLW